MDNRFAAFIHGALCLVLACALAACDGKSNTRTDATVPVAKSPAPKPPVSSPPPPPSAPPPLHLDAAPQISGTPPRNAVAGQMFSFQPNAADADGDRLTFTVASKPKWAHFDTSTGHLSGTPHPSDVGTRDQVMISVSDGTHTQPLPSFTLTVVMPRKNAYGHYFATHYSDTPADAAMLCEHAGVSGIVWRQTWKDVEPAPGVYDFSSFDKVLAAIAASQNPKCQLWLMVEFKSFVNSPERNPCPVYLQAQHSAPNVYGGGTATCFMWEPVVVRAYSAMMAAAAGHFDNNPRIEGLILEESSLSLNGKYSQDVGDGGTYTPMAWRDALIELIDNCSASFAASRCMSFLNFLRGGQSYLYDISAAITAVPDNRVCISGPDVLPNSPSLYAGKNAIYQVISRHAGCRANSAQNNSYEIPGCNLECIFQFAIGGTLGGFPTNAPLSGGLCVNSYLFWNDRTIRSGTGLTWKDALPVIAAHPYGTDWLSKCNGNDGLP